MYLGFAAWRLLDHTLLDRTLPAAQVLNISSVDGREGAFVIDNNIADVCFPSNHYYSVSANGEIK